MSCAEYFLYKPFNDKFLINNYTSQILAVKKGYNYFDSTQLGYMEVKKGWIPIISAQKNNAILIAYTNITIPFFDYQCFTKFCSAITTNNLKLAIKINLFNSTIFYSKFSKSFTELGVQNVQIKTFNNQFFRKYFAINSFSNITSYKSKLSKIKFFILVLIEKNI